MGPRAGAMGPGSPAAPGPTLEGIRLRLLRLDLRRLARLRLGRLVQPLDLGGLAQLENELLLGLAGQVLLDLLLHLLEGRHGLPPLLLELDDVPAELALHRLRDLARL